MIGTEIKDKTPSEYQPSEAVNNITDKVKQDYGVGYEILHRPFREFNDLNLIERCNVNQKMFNGYIELLSNDPDEDWRWNGIRPFTRNQVISMSAHFISNMIYPAVFAQNDQDEEDKESAQIMRYMLEWNIRNSDYELTYLYGVIAALVNPVIYYSVDFVQSLQTVREKTDNGKFIKKQIVDDIFSGLQTNLLPAEEILISNPYQFSLQKQRFLIRRRFIDYNEIEGIYGEHKNFNYVEKGIRNLYDSATQSFYAETDTDLDTLAEEAIYYNRQEDIEISFINGVYFGDNNVDNNLIKHRDNKNKPKYPFAKTGFEPIDEKRFWAYISLVCKLADTQDLGDRMWQMVMDGTFLSVKPPIITTGGAKIDSSIMYPGAVTNFGRDVTVNPIKTGDLGAGYNALKLIEQSVTESSQEPQRAGIYEEGSKTAYEVAKIEQNAKVQLGIFGTMMNRLVKDVGDLMIDNIVQHQTVAEMEELLGPEMKLKYRTYLLPESPESGKKVTRKIKFTNKMMGKKMTEDERMQESYRIMEKEGGFDSDTRIYLVNPQKFSKLKFQIYNEPDVISPLGDQYQERKKLAYYDKMIQNPYVDQEAITRELLLEPIFKGEAEKYLRKKSLFGDLAGGILQKRAGLKSKVGEPQEAMVV